MADQADRLGQERISRLLIKFSVPAIVGMLVQALYNVVDRIFVGRGVGADGIAGITICFPFQLLIMGFSMLIGVGGTALISLKLGEGRRDEAEKVLGNAMFLMFSIAVLMTISGEIFLDPLLVFFGASKTLLPYSHDYMKIVLMGTIFQVTAHGMNNFIRGEGNPRRAMSTMITGAVLNIILDPIFIFRLDLGIEGAAIATLAAQVVSASLVLGYFFGGQSLVKVHSKNFRLDWRIVRPILAIGAAPFALQIASSMLNTILNHQLKIHGGDLAVSVMGILFSVTMLVLMPVFGISQGAQPIIGYNYGAREFKRVRRTLKSAIIASSVLCIIGFVLAMAVPDLIIGLFAKQQPELLAAGSRAMRINLCLMPVIGFQIVSSQYFMAVGKATLSMILGLSRQILILIPLIILLPRFYGLDGIWIAGPVSDLAAAILTGGFILAEIKNLKKTEVLSGAACAAGH